MYNHYNTERSDDGLLYTFTTRFNVKYLLALTLVQIGEVGAFSISLYPEEENNIFDYWIKNTVINTIGDLLKKDSNVIFYVCDNEDDREDKRHLVFEYWYEKSKKEFDYIEKYNYSVMSDNGYKINSSILYNKENYLADYLIYQFKQLMQSS